MEIHRGYSPPQHQKKNEVFSNNLISLKKGNLSLDEYLYKFKIICDNLATINKHLEKLTKSSN